MSTADYRRRGSLHADMGPGHKLTAAVVNDQGDLGQITCTCGFVAPADDSRQIDMVKQHVDAITKAAGA